ncbi:MAG: biopolymer transporter ExbD [Pirellulaceae bacterium]
MRLSKRQGKKLDFNMTPMIDVTFLLIIFFMTVNQMSRTNKEAIPLPSLAGSQDQSEGTLTINVDLAGAMIVSSRTVNMNELIALLTTAISDVGGEPGQVTIVVRAHRDGTCRTVNDIIRTLDKLQITRVRLAVESTP